MSSTVGTALAVDTDALAACDGADAGPDAGPCSGPAAACAGPAVAGGGIEDDLGWALGTVFRSYRRATGAVLDALPGGPRGYQVLATAVRDGARPQAVLAAHLGVDRTVMTYLLDDLEKAGVLARQPDPGDRRVRLVAATDAGRTRLAELETRLRGAEGHVLSRLGSQDAEVFRSLLRRLACDADDDATGVAGCPRGSADACDAALTDQP